MARSTARQAADPEWTELVHTRVSKKIKSLLRARAGELGVTETSYVRQMLYRELTDKKAG
jgi:hypothetical protein